jgi:hypothetical protein
MCASSRMMTTIYQNQLEDIGIIEIHAIRQVVVPLLNEPYESAIDLFILYFISDPVFNQMKSNNQALGADIQFGALSKVKLYSNNQ